MLILCAAAAVACGQPFQDLFSVADPQSPITDPVPVIMAGAYLGGIPVDSPENRVDPNVPTSPFAGVAAVVLNGSFLGTAVPITREHLLTAGHVVDLDNNGVVDTPLGSLAIHFNSNGDSTYILGVAAIALHPDFTGFNHPALNDDLAVLTLTQAIPIDVPIYPLLERPLQQGDELTLVGYGRSGWGDLGFRPPLENANVKRVGRNVADAAFLDDEGLIFPEVYVFDFDGPDDTTSILGGLTLGNDIETTLGFGDSGGPAFVLDAGIYKLAGINSFIARFTGSSASPPLFGSAGGGIMVFPAAPWIAEQTGLPWTLNTLQLNVEGDPAYLQPGQFVTIDMDVRNLAQRVTGVQAFLNFSSANFSALPGDVNVAAGGGVWEELLWNTHTTSGDLDVAIGVSLNNPGGTSTDATAARITLKALGEGTTQVVFRPDVKPDPGMIQTTLFSDENSQTVLPRKVNSQSIIIDGTPPAVTGISAVQSGTELIPATTAIQGVVDITIQATDNLAGIAGAPTVTLTIGSWSETANFVNESPAGEYHYQWSVQPQTPNGLAVLSVTGLTDRAGNTADSVSASFPVNKNQVIATIEFQTFSSSNYTVTRDVVLVATDTQGGVLGSWTLPQEFENNATTLVAQASYILTAVPDEIAWLSAKTDWHLRRRVAVSLDGDGQADVLLTLKGGDLDGSNSINVLDYSILRSSWGGGAAGDVNGDGGTGTVDYSILKDNWFGVGDPQ